MEKRTFSEKAEALLQFKSPKFLRERTSKNRSTVQDAPSCTVLPVFPAGTCTGLRKKFLSSYFSVVYTKL